MIAPTARLGHYHHAQWLRPDMPASIAPESEAAGNGAVERNRPPRQYLIEIIHKY
jgi:hypothetical protein